MMCYLHATVKHMSIVSVLQARQHELLTAEVAELRKHRCSGARDSMGAGMNTQPQWPSFATLESRALADGDAKERLAALQSGKREAKARLRGPIACSISEWLVSICGFNR
jgi:hypothetical protein